VWVQVPSSALEKVLSYYQGFFFTKNAGADDHEEKNTNIDLCIDDRTNGTDWMYRREESRKVYYRGSGQLYSRDGGYAGRPAQCAKRGGDEGCFKYLGCSGKQ